MDPKRYCCDLCQSMFCLCFSHKSFRASGLPLKSLTQFELLCKVLEDVLILFFTCSFQVFPTPIIEETVFIIPSCILCCRLIDHRCMVYFWAFYPLPLVYISVFLCQYHTVLIIVILEKEMATHSSILARRIPWTEELQSMGVTKSQTRVSRQHVI